MCLDTEKGERRKEFKFLRNFSSPHVLFQCPKSVLCPTSYVLLPTSYFLCPTSYVLCPTSYLLLLTKKAIMAVVNIPIANAPINP